jgi:hypothetical protein
MNILPPQTMVLPTRNRLRLTGDTTNKLKANPEHKRANESTVICHREGWQRDCTRMLDLL